MAILEWDIRIVTVLRDSDEVAVLATKGLWLQAADMERATGWSVKPEGFCQEGSCVPAMSSMIDGDWVDAATFWHKVSKPILSDRSGDVWILGRGASTRRSAVDVLDAPDFELPDLRGTRHRLSALRGNKVLLVTWAS